MANISITLGGVLLPDSTVLQESVKPNESNNIVLDGTLYTDFISMRRSWVVSWKRLSKTDYDAIRGVFDDQYSNEEYPILEIPYYIIEVPVKVTISTKDIKFDGDCIVEFSLTLDEQYAIS